MSHKKFVVDTFKPFSESLLWQLNRDYYQNTGIDAWQSGVVPHDITSNSRVGKTYAHLIFGFLKDLASKGIENQKVYILEVGAGHARLAFHILKHLDDLLAENTVKVPDYCYILSDIVEDNLAFFQNHMQLAPYYKSGRLEVAYFDAINGKELDLRVSGDKLEVGQLDYPLVVVANYFFDSLPADLFYYKDKTVQSCEVSLNSHRDISDFGDAEKLKNIALEYKSEILEGQYYENPIFNQIIEEYRNLVFDSYIFFPVKGIMCLENLNNLSSKGMLLLTMDKGFHEIHDLEDAKRPKLITHGSISFSMNYHALAKYCELKKGNVMFPSYSTYDVEVGVLMFLEKNDSYNSLKSAYQLLIDDFGPDDFTGIKKFLYTNVSKLNLQEIIGFIRLGAYDGTIFKNLLPKIKHLKEEVTFNDRRRLSQTMHKVWDMYFDIGSSEDLAYEIGGVYYDLGFYENALFYFNQSINRRGTTPDAFYNIILCYYQLRQDDSFIKNLTIAKTLFPDYENFIQLEKLDLEAS